MSSISCRKLMRNCTVLNAAVFFFFFLSAVPSQPPAGVRATLIEDDTALVSWREPPEPNVVVTHYTIMYASQKSWVAGNWQIIQREGEYLNLLEEDNP